MTLDFSEIIENVRNTLENNRKTTLLVCVLLLVMTLSAIIVVFVQDSSKKNALSKKTSAEQKLILSHPLLIPSGVVVSNDYITSRKPKKNWSESEVQDWFTIPDETELQKLGQANDKIVDEIIGAAP